MTNEKKAREIAQKYGFVDEQIGDEDERYRACLEMAEWKDKQFENAIKEIKANVIESRDNKEYYKTNRETTLNWILRLIDECCESISIQKENKL